MKIIRLSMVNVVTGERGIPGFIDAATITKWYRWLVPDDFPVHQQSTPHRTLRGKRLIVIENTVGQSWTDEDFHTLSARILSARGMEEEAKNEIQLGLQEIAGKSPLAV